MAVRLAALFPGDGELRPRHAVQARAATCPIALARDQSQTKRARLEWRSPAGVPQAIVNKLSAEVARIVQLPDMAQCFQLDGAEAVGSSPQEFAGFLKAEMQKWRLVVRDAGIKPEQ